MISVDTNILLYAQNQDCPEHEQARSFLQRCADRSDVAICELVLLELYQLLRNPAVVQQPLEAGIAAGICRAYRGNPRWAVIENAPVMGQVWKVAGRAGVARRQVFDARIAFTLIYHGVDEFATRNTSDFRNFGFARLINPIDA